MPVFSSTRCACAVGSMCAGLSVAIAMQAAGGDLARFLPDAPLFHVSAASGAALAGFLLADGFGRLRWRGHLIGGLTCVVVTLLGAWFGAFIALAFTASGHAGATLSDVVGNAPLLGFVAIADALSTSLPVAATWAIAMTLVQLWMRRRRGAQPT